MRSRRRNGKEELNAEEAEDTEDAEGEDGREVQRE